MPSVLSNWPGLACLVGSARPAGGLPLPPDDRLHIPTSREENEEKNKEEEIKKTIESEAEMFPGEK